MARYLDRMLIRYHLHHRKQEKIRGIVAPDLLQVKKKKYFNVDTFKELI
jgi:hypothetical protein